MCTVYTYTPVSNISAVCLKRLHYTACDIRQDNGDRIYCAMLKFAPKYISYIPTTSSNILFGRIGCASVLHVISTEILNFEIECFTIH